MTNDPKAPPKPKNPFSPMDEEQLQGMKTALEQDPVIVEGAAQAPEDIRRGLEESPKEFLEGYLLGVSQALALLDAANKAAQQGDMTTANALGNRANTVNYIICKLLLEGQSRIITPSGSGKIIH